MSIPKYNQPQPLNHLLDYKYVEILEMTSYFQLTLILLIVHPICQLYSIKLKLYILIIASLG